MASTKSAAQQAIYQRFRAAWIAAYGAAEADRIAWANVAFQPPTPPESWVRVTVLWGDGVASTMNGRNTTAGVISVQLFVPRGTAQGALTARADQIADTFDRADFEALAGHMVRCDVASGPKLRPSGGPDAGIWEQATVTIGFTYDDVP